MASSVFHWANNKEGFRKPGTMPWFKLHREARSSRKLLALGGPDCKLTMWLLLMLSTDNDGMLPIRIEHKEDADFIEAALLDGTPRFIQPEHIIQALPDLIERGCIDVLEDGRMQLHDFNEWNSRSPEAIRQERFRQNHPEKFPGRKGKKQRVKVPAEVNAAPFFASPVEEFHHSDQGTDTGDIARNGDAVTNNVEIEDRRNKKEEEREEKPLHPLLSAEQKRRKRMAPAATPEWAYRACEEAIEAYHPNGRSNIETGRLIFISLCGLPAPGEPGVEIERSGIPTYEYFQEHVLPAIKAARVSAKWAKNENGEQFVHNFSTFLTGSKNPANPTFGRMWRDDWPPSAEHTAEQRIEQEGEFKPDFDYQPQRIGPDTEPRKPKPQLIRRHAQGAE